MKILLWVFVVLYLGALLLLAISTFGWFGQERDPLGGVFLLPLGLPWNLLASRSGIDSPVVLMAAPMVNVAIIYALGKYIAGRAAGV